MHDVTIRRGGHEAMTRTSITIVLEVEFDKYANVWKQTVGMVVKFNDSKNTSCIIIEQIMMFNVLFHEWLKSINILWVPEEFQ